MKRTHKLALAGAATLLSSVAVFTGVSSSYAAPANKARPARVAQVCVPAVPNPSDYTNCRLVRVQGDTTCRCRIVPQEQRQVQTPLDRGNLVTGAVLGLGAFGLINTDRPGDHGGTREGFASNNAPGGTSPERPAAARMPVAVPERAIPVAADTRTMRRGRAIAAEADPRAAAREAAARAARIPWRLESRRRHQPRQAGPLPGGGTTQEVGPIQGAGPILVTAATPVAARTRVMAAIPAVTTRAVVVTTVAADTVVGITAVATAAEVMAAEVMAGVAMAAVVRGGQWRRSWRWWSWRWRSRRWWSQRRRPWRRWSQRRWSWRRQWRPSRRRKGP